MDRRILGMWVAVLLVLGFLIFRGVSVDGLDENESVVVRSGKSESFLAVNGKSDAGGRSGRELGAATHKMEDLRDFYLPSAVLENVSLEEALAALIQSYGEVCEETGEVPVSVTYEVKGNADMIRRLNLKSHSFLASVNLVAALSGMKMSREGGHLVFEEVSGDREQNVVSSRWGKKALLRELGELLDIGIVTITESRIEQPVFSSRRVSQGVSLNTDDSKRALRSIVDLERRAKIVNFEPLANYKLSANGEGYTYVNGESLTELLEAAGLLSDGESVKFKYSDEKSRVDIDASHKNAERMMALINELDQEVPQQVKLHLNGSGGQVFPAVMAKPGQEATIEIGKSYKETVLLPSGQEQNVEDFVGTSIVVTPELYGFGENVGVNYIHAAPPSEEALAVFQQTGKLADLQVEWRGLEGSVFSNGHEASLEDLDEGVEVKLTSERIGERGLKLLNML